VTDIFQLALAFIYVLFVPGFAMTLAVFPRLNQLEITERVALSIGLSLTIVIAMDCCSAIPKPSSPQPAASPRTRCSLASGL